MLFYLCSYHVGGTEDTDGGYVDVCSCRYVITLFLGPHHKRQGEPGTFCPEGEGRAIMGKYATKTTQSIEAARHFAHLYDGKLPRGLCCSGYVIFWYRDRNTKFNIHQI